MRAMNPKTRDPDVSRTRCDSNAFVPDRRRRLGYNHFPGGRGGYDGPINCPGITGGGQEIGQQDYYNKPKRFPFHVNFFLIIR
jgi:hypothetical protein